MRIATASLNQTPLDWNRNVDNIRCTLDWARKNDTMVLCLPELCIPGAGCGRHFKRPRIVGKSMDFLLELLPELRGMIVTLGLPLEYEGHVFNTVCLVVDGKPFGFQCKTRFSNLHEADWFRPWMRNRHAVFELNGESYKIGDLSFEFKLNEERTFHVAVEVGEPDWSSPAPPVASERQKVDLLLNPMASRFALEKHARRIRYAETATKEGNYVHVFSNYVGNESGPTIYDGGSFIAESGQILAVTPRFSYHDVQVVSATLGAAAVSPDTFGKEEEFSHAVPLGMLDYLRKSGAKGFALSLSGGADSAAVAVCVSLGVQMAREELGPEGFCQQFGFIPGIKSVESTEEIVHRMLVCLYQATRNSGETTKKAAETLAQQIGAEYHWIDVEPLVRQYVSTISQALSREPNWDTDDIALQNIQARVRAPSAWLVANLRSLLLLATGNRSEATLGYATMDGDTSGGIAPIGGIDKVFLRHWIRWMEKEGPKCGDKRITMPFLSVISDQAPTAELRPPSKHQTDEADLMPYPVLNRIEQMVIAQGKSLKETPTILAKEFSQYSVEQLQEWVDQFYRLWRRNQWKRYRYALSFHLDDSSLSGDDWLQYPTLVGNF